MTRRILPCADGDVLDCCCAGDDLNVTTYKPNTGDVGMDALDRLAVPTCLSPFGPHVLRPQGRPQVELIDQFYAEYPVGGGEPDTVDIDEVLTAIAKTVAELTFSQNDSIRQQIIEKLPRDAGERRADGD